MTEVFHLGKNQCICKIKLCGFLDLLSVPMFLLSAKKQNYL